MKLPKSDWPLILAIFVTILTQVIYWQSKPELGNCYDCGEYQDLANFIYREPKNIISDFRPPLYPVFMIINGLSSPNPQGDFNLYLSQSAILILSLIVFWRLIRTSELPQEISWAPLLLLSISPAFFSFTKFKLTETTNMFLILVLITIALKLKDKMNIRGVLLFSFVSVVATFVRFANSYLSLAVVLAISFYYERRLLISKNYLKIVLILLLTTAPQVIYSAANLHRNYYFGLSGETGANFLGKLVQYQLLPKEDPDFEKIVDALNSCKGELARNDVFTCIWNFLPKNSFVSKYSVDNHYVDTFAKKYILLNLLTYVSKSIPVAFEAISTPADMYLSLSQTEHPLFVAEKAVAATVHKLLVVWLFVILPIFLIAFRKQILNKDYFIVLLFLAINLYYIAITGLAAINDYQRIVTPTIPLFYFLVTSTCYKILNTLKLKL